MVRRSPSARLRVIATIKVGAASAATYGEGSFWVAVSANDGSFRGRILRINPATNKIVAKISVRSVPGWEIGGGGLAVGDGSVWVTGGIDALGHGSNAVLIRIDPKTDRVIDTIHLGGVFGDDVTIDKNAVWVLIDDDSNTPEILRIDPSTDTVAATIPLAYQNSHFIFAVAGSILADGHTTGNGIVGNSILSRLDPATNQVTTNLPFGGYVWPAAGDDAVWAATGSMLVQIDPETDQVIGLPIRMRSTGDALAVGDGGVWFLKPDHRNRLFRFNPAAGKVDASVRLPVGTTPLTIVLSREDVWILNNEGSVSRVEVRH